jgi:hypothetical protein
VENNVLRKIFGHEKEQVTRGTDKLEAEEMHRTFPIKPKERRQAQIGEYYNVLI